MKKILILILSLIMCLGCFASCTSGDEGAALTDAAEYLRSIYKDNAKETISDYDVVGKIVIGETTFTVTWTTDNESITVKESSKAGFYTVDLPAKNDEAVDYKLTATIADAKGNTETVSFDRTLGVYDASAIVAKPEEGVAYKFYMVHAGLSQTLFAIGETQDNQNKFILSTTDPKAAPDFFVEADGEGFKFYTTIGGAKMYLKASTTTSEDGKVSKYIGYDAEAGSTWIYKSETNAWFTTVDGVEYVVGTYGTYSTFCISESSYISVENSGKTQFPGGLMLKEVAEAMTPSEGPTIYETPEEIVNAVYDLAIGGILSAGHKYTLTGVITEIPSLYDEGYGNITVVIVVGDMTDKPIECFRLKGDGIKNLEVGNTITVTGELLKYDNKSETGKVEFNAGCTLDSSDACAHVEETLAGKDATCTEAGLTEGKKCSTCGDILVEQTEIPALGHDWNAVLAHDADNHWTTCTRCEETKDKAAHNNGDDSVCDTCGYGCEHKDVNEATCTAPATCKDCGANTAPAKGHTEETVPAVAPTCKDTGLTEGKKCSVCGETLQAQETVEKTNDHTYTDNKDTTCDVCGFERELVKTVVIYFPKDSKYMTGEEHYYAPKKMELILSENKAEAVPMEQITNADGSVSFKAGNKYLFADGTHVEFVSVEGENTKFALEETEGGVFIRCFTANYSGKPQYLEVYSGYMTCYGMNASTADIFTFQILDADGANGTVKDNENSKVEGTGGGNETPSVGATSIQNGVSSVAADTSYKLAGVNASGQLYFDGTLNNGRINGAASGVTVKLEAGAAAGEYYIYFMDGSTKTYIGMDDGDDSSSFIFSTEKSDACVWVIDASAKTIVSKVYSNRGMATQNTSTFNNFSTYAVSNFGTDPIYVPCWFVAA